VWLSSTSRPDSVANIVRPDSAADIGSLQGRGRFRGPRVAWPTSRIPRPDSVADSEARELRGRLQGPPAAWPTCDPFRRRPSVSTKGAGAEVEEAQAGRALSAPTTRHPRRRSQRPAPSARAHEGA
jgi:hypothetical protein